MKDTVIHQKLWNHEQSIVSNPVPDLKIDEWVAVDMGSFWYPAQFIQYDKEEELLEVTFLHPSISTSEQFVRPQMNINGKEDKAWVSEGKHTIILIKNV